MKKNPISISARTFAAMPFLITGVVLLALSTIYGGSNRAGRSIARPNAPQPTQFSGTYDPHVFGAGCTTPLQHFNVPVGQTRLVVQTSAALPTNDITVTLLFGPDVAPVLVQGPEDTGTSSEALVYAPPAGVPAGRYHVQICQTPSTNGVPQMAPFTYNGIFTIDDTALPVGGGGGTPPPFGAIPQAPQDTGPKIGFENFTAPGALIPVTTTSAGLQVASVEYMGRNAGEPSIGNNWLTDTTVFYSDLQSLFVTFNDTCPLSGASATWINRAAPTAQAVDSDPIGFTDSELGRSFSGQLTLLTPTCKTSYTTDDGATWIPTQGSGFASGVDHQSIGGGRYAAPLNLNPPSPAYPHAVYYCSQEGVPNTGPPSFCSRSDTGGLTFDGPSVPLTTPPVNVCGGLHGHVKVSPKDGSVYVPFNQCDGVASVVVSLDNGITWTVRHVGTTTQSLQPSASFQDPAISIDTTGRIYYVLANNDTDAAIMTSDDHGASWQNLGEISSVYGLKNIRYPAATAGDAGRAAVSFYGTTTAGDALLGTFPGVWHLYVSNTFDGGKTWTTTDATPNAPMQRGCIWAKGGANICRNLLDFFDMTVDKNGRIEVGYVNGCEGGNCVQAPLTAQGESPAGQGNAYTDTATIARQSSGRRLFFAKDPATPTSKPGMPLLTERRVGNVIFLQWSEADTGNLMINNYEILRGTASNGETHLATVTGTQIGGTYTDVRPANDTTTYFYKVIANSSPPAGGSSCGNNEIAAPFLGDTCTGIIIHRNDPAHKEANAAQGNTPPSLLIDYVAVGEPAGSTDFLFKMKVNNLSTVPPNTRWRMAWDSFSSPGQQYYVGMTTGASGPPTFEYGTLADAGLPAVFVISETTVASCAGATTSCTLPTTGGASSFNADGTIILRVPKSAFGNPQPGALLGGVNGRTITGDVPGSPESKLERSNAFTDHTFVKAQTDQSFPASTYMVLGNSATCGTGLTAVGAVSRKTHTGVGDFDVDLPFIGTPGIECRTGGPSNDHKVVVTFPVNITSISSATVDHPNGTASIVGSPAINGSVVTINLTNVSNAQTITIHLIGVTAGSSSGNVDIPMSVLLGDTTASKTVNASDISQTKAQSGTAASNSNFRTDVTINGVINSSDISTVKSKSGTGIP
jgi:hypothetical protein